MAQVPTCAQYAVLSLLEKGYKREAAVLAPKRTIGACFQRGYISAALNLTALGRRALLWPPDAIDRYADLCRSRLAEGLRSLRTGNEMPLAIGTASGPETLTGGA